ncbi:MAG: sigma-54-dependent Fis family transcriptional regulator [Deltaproteobacteria bacterium]|nr:sigma-54-dependent Fis family transcriptional regulator [Deltaproteobacteria bacterium]MBW2382188.1 sigma-54-dependent Fis family transcriptional regulator [Deltaproteobacteria bacterium]MBW2697670.1 sigma-54-dependent Fis family transcriptional regulator [Deltaproteobacteria bacterium]
MKLFEAGEQAVLEALAGLSDCNQFLPERIALERKALGDAYQGSGAVWHAEAESGPSSPNLEPLARLAEELAERLRERLAAGASAGSDALLLYEGLIRYLLYSRYESDFFDLIRDGEAGRPATGKVDAYRKHARDVEHFLHIPGIRIPVEVDAAHLFAWGYQIRRAFHHTFRRIYGGSMPAARLRTAVWQSIFTHDAQRYGRGLYQRLGDVPTLIVGESGTGKELVARAIGLSRYVPFEAERQCFAADPSRLFFPVNVSALSPTLVESELFGHRRGAFTGAAEDRTGWFETCTDLGTVFLDEIGELPPEIQVKLLRVLQSRSFQRVGEVAERRFGGKIVAATNRNLADEMEAGRFRHDFYYRLSGDVVHTPTLREQLAESPGELRGLVLIIARRVAGPDEAERLSAEVVDWVEAHLGHEHGWKGNVRELEQCVRNVMIRGEYHPIQAATRSRSGAGGLVEAIEAGDLSADDLLRHYCTLVYARAGSYEEAARRLGLDRRTVKAKIDEGLLEQLRSDD